jgi:putative flippase GtrA
MKTLLQQVMGYGAASLIALAADMSILWALVTYVGLPYLVAATLSFLAGASVAYFFSVRFAFKEHRLRDRGAEFASFVAIGTLGLVVNACVMDAAVRYLGLHLMMAKGVAAVCTFTCNFLTRRQLLFVRSREACLRDLSHD